MKVIVAETDWPFAQHVRSYLETRAHLVAFETQREQLIRRVQQWQPDLLILAAELTEDGTLQALMQLKPRPAILLSEYMDRYDRAWRAWQLGGDDILMKPIFTTDELQESISTALEKAATGARVWTAAAGKISA